MIGTVGPPVHKMMRLVLLAVVGFMFLMVLLVVWLSGATP